LSISGQLREDLIEARRQVWESHHGDPNFTGCGIGYRRRGGNVTDEPVVVAMVVDKLPAGAVSTRRLLPETIRVNGVEHGVDVVEAGPVYASGLSRDGMAPTTVENHPALTGRYRPLAQGCGISNAVESVKPTGTLGCIAYTNLKKVMLTAGHVMDSELWLSDPSKTMMQPAATDGGDPSNDAIDMTQAGASFVDITPGSTANTIDVGFVVLDHLDDSAPTDVADNLMAPISNTHPAVGMCIASDGEGNSFLSRMDLSVAWVNSIIADTLQIAVVVPEVGVNIEKVGRSSAYTSSTVDATDVVLVVYYPDEETNKYIPVTMSGMIWSQWFCISGDSGAVACVGGDGQTYVTPPRSPCALMKSIETYYGLPNLTADNTITNQVQSKVLSQTLIGNLAIGMVYENKQVAIDRLASSTGPAFNQAAAQALFQSLYTKYRPIIIGLLNNPGAFGFTQDMAQDAYYTYGMLYDQPADGSPGYGILTRNEAGVAVYMAAEVVYFANSNYTYDEFMAYCDTPSYYDAWREIIAQAPTLSLP
jgi:hypothetical protein